MDFKIVSIRTKIVSLLKLWDSKTEMQELTLKTPQGTIPMCFSREHHLIIPWLKALKDRGIISAITTLINYDTHPDTVPTLFDDLTDGSWLRHMRMKNILTGLAVWVRGEKNTPTMLGTRENELRYGYGSLKNIFYTIKEMLAKVSGPAIVTLDLDFIACDLESVTNDKIEERMYAFVNSVFKSKIKPVAFHVCVSEAFLMKRRSMYDEKIPELLLNTLQNSLQREGFQVLEQ